jgi:hypothetical protein
MESGNGGIAGIELQSQKHWGAILSGSQDRLTAG